MFCVCPFVCRGGGGGGGVDFVTCAKAVNRSFKKKLSGWAWPMEKTTKVVERSESYSGYKKNPEWPIYIYL